MNRVPPWQTAATVAALGIITSAAPSVLGTAAVAQSAAATPQIPAPQIPKRVFRVTGYGAVGNGTTKDTAALQKAINACLQAGGGTVLVPAGRFLTGPLELGSNLELRLARGATLVMSDDTHDYPITNFRFQDCISAKNAHDIAITGEGTIEGQGGIWWQHFVSRKNGDPGSAAMPHRPFLVVLTGCKRVLVQGVTLQNSPMFHLVPQKCEDVRINGIHIQAPERAPNTDGLDPSGWNFLIENCTFNVGDDCIALKPSGRIKKDQPACKNFVIEHCDFQHGHGMSIGGQTPGGLDGLVVRDSTFEGTDAGIRMKAARGSGGLVENAVYENLKMTDVKVPIQITSYYSPGQKHPNPATDPAQPVTATTPIWRNITIRNVTATGARTDAQMIGLPEMPIANVSLTNVHLTGHNGIQIVHARGVRFVNSSVEAGHGERVVLADAEVTGLAADGATKLTKAR